MESQSAEETGYANADRDKKLLKDVRLGPKKLHLLRSAKGDVVIGIVTENECGTTGKTSSVPKAHKTYADRYLLESAMLDKRLFRRLLDGYDALLEMDWVGESLISHVETEIAGNWVPQKQKDFFEKDQFHTEGYLEMFAEWGLDEMDNAYAAIDALYRACRRKTPLTAKRYR